MPPINEKELVRHIVESKAPPSLADLVRHYRIKGAQRREFRRLLAALEQEGRIARIRGKHYTAPRGRSGGIVGRLEVTAKGFGFVRPDWSGHDGTPLFPGDLFIPPRNMGAALDGDLVRAEVLRTDGQGVSGRIQEVLEHVHQRIVGYYQQISRRDGVVFPRNQRIERRINVPLPGAGLGVSDFDWVEVEIDDYPLPPHPLQGRVIARLGEDSDRGIDVLLLLRDKGILEEFPASVEQEAASLDFAWKKDLKGRRDLRGLPTLTIDPATAKDFDDGLSIEKLEKGGHRLYVHIADVSHFVKMGSPLDREAQERSTSCYPVDRVVPMLPERLSNHLCSLVADEDRLTVTAEMEFDRNGKMVAKKVYSSVIRSDHRFAYEDVQKFFDGGTPAEEVPAGLGPVLEGLLALSRKLRRRRFKRGALDLDIPEVQVIFDEKGRVADLAFYPRFEAHQLVEECMLAANEAVAQLLEERDAPLLYRIHETADEERLERLHEVLSVFGIRLSSGKGPITPKDVQAALEKAQALPAGHMIRRLVLRAMKRAEYDPENVGHFGLASKAYCHFTSPIRRYPDVIVHRQLKAIEAGGPLAYTADDNELDFLGDHTSARERRAQEAEWEAVTIKSLEFMKQFEGEEFDGHIASVHNFGLFVELDRHPVEGLVKVQGLRDDRYDLDELGIRLIGRRSGRVLRLADQIRVRIDKIDIMAQQMDLSPAASWADAAGGAKHRSRKRRRW